MVFMGVKNMFLSRYPFFPLSARTVMALSISSGVGLRIIQCSLTGTAWAGVNSRECEDLAPLVSNRRELK